MKFLGKKKFWPETTFWPASPPATKTFSRNHAWSRKIAWYIIHLSYFNSNINHELHVPPLKTKNNDILAENYSDSNFVYRWKRKRDGCDLTQVTNLVWIEKSRLCCLFTILSQWTNNKMKNKSLTRTLVLLEFFYVHPFLFYIKHVTIFS